MFSSTLTRIDFEENRNFSVFVMSSSSVKSNISDQETANNGTTNAAADCCSSTSSELNLYQAFIFSVPIFFTFIVLFVFYLFYLRRRRVDWSSLRMRTSNSLQTPEDVSLCELGLKKELREMLPIIIFKESFTVKDTQCSVCLGDYQAEDRLQQIPGCGHTFHTDCIDLWLATHVTCPLCRLSLVAGFKTTHVEETNNRPSNAQNEASNLHGFQSTQDSQIIGRQPLHERDDQVPTVNERDKDFHCACQEQ